MKKIKLILLTLFAFIGLSASSQVLNSFNLYVINQNFCQYTLVGNYYGNGVAGSITFTPQPIADTYICTVPAVDSLTINICGIFAFPCQGEQCLTDVLYLGLGQGTPAFTIVLSQADSDNDGYPDSFDCNPFDSTVHPNATEICDGVDNNCDGLLETTPSINAYFVPDSIVSEPNTIYVVCQTYGAVSWLWSFGNGQVFSEQYPTTLYTEPGTYTFCLQTVSFEGCETDTCLTLSIDTSGVWTPGGVMTDYTLHIVPEYTVGVTELTNNVKVWPNPVSGIVNINTPSNSGMLRIVSVDGRCVYQEKYFSKNIQFDSEVLGQGTYVITLTDDSGKFYTTRIIK